jgi:hypothetical protein
VRKARRILQGRGGNLDPCWGSGDWEECRETLSGERHPWRAKGGRRAERRVERVRLLRVSSVRSLTRLYGSGQFGDGCDRPRTENSRGRAKHERWCGDTLEQTPWSIARGWGASWLQVTRLERCSVSLHRALRRHSVDCRYINMPILPRGNHGSNAALIRNSGARYLFGIAHNQTQRVRKNESKTRSEKETIPLASRFRSPPYSGNLPHAVCSSGPSVPFPIAVAIPMKTIK